MIIIKAPVYNNRAALTAERVRAALYYNPQTGSWRNRKFRGRLKTGVKAGSVSPQGYKQIGIDDQKHSGGALAVLYMTGKWAKRVHYLDGNPQNCKWKNLFPVWAKPAKLFIVKKTSSAAHASH